ncbi:HD domain-containing phosphohydrolase [Rubrobacter aplysinae]|uniref:HD domain-containing phosphohydrolase n=1 Tax=Rubrobacter aplysinae TaxID=909625 RepID=UPI001364BB49|nr:HD domain-containing phosphohydrolase [Rubrobacter aplysinae]
MASNRSASPVESTLQIAREQLGMDVSFVSEFDGDWLAFRDSKGDMDSFAGAGTAGGMPLEAAYCKRTARSESPYLITNAKTDEVAREMPVTWEADVGSYVGVPIVFSDGEVHGTFCTMSHSPAPSIRDRDIEFMKVLARIAAEQLEREAIQAERKRLAAESSGLRALVAALNARDGYTAEHSETVVELASQVAEQMGLSQAETSEVRQAALLHDVGKIAVPDEILRKPGKLDEHEWAIMRQHPDTAEKIVSSIPELSHLAPVVRADHERWDGTGYPRGLRGEEIPLASRIVFACDTWDAMSTNRPYRKALGIRERFEELENASGGQLDPDVVTALKPVLAEYGFLDPE